ncbi:MAG: FKBP-type peptidyl-prolyl cis-trans isomerase [Paludibacter sp.]
MKTNKLFFLSISILSILISSCNTYDNSTDDFSKYKLDNETYFSNMKDSAGYVLYSIPIARGGSSFYYKITTQGNQNYGSPTLTDSVKVNYRGRFVNGNVFEQTYTGSLANNISAKPYTFKLDGLLGGWQENLTHMKAGEIRTIVLPQELGYGVYGAGPIPPFSTLVFEIQLITFTSQNK